MTIAVLVPILKFLAAWILLLSFALLAQRRLLSLTHLLAWQGGTLALSTALVAVLTGDGLLWVSAGLTLLLKALLIPAILHRLLRRLQVRGDVEMTLNATSTQLLGIVVVVFAFALASPLAGSLPVATHGMLGIALASFLIAFLLTRPLNI